MSRVDPGPDTHDLEETVFYESVHAAWDKQYSKSAEWQDAQEKGGRFITDYARKNPQGENLAESALFAFTLLHHPERIPKEEASKIAGAIPSRIAFIEKLLPKGKPLHFDVKGKWGRTIQSAGPVLSACSGPRGAVLLRPLVEM